MERIQRKRTKGWRLPENTVSVTRPSGWGNPFKIGEQAPPIFDEMYSGTNRPPYLDEDDYLIYGIRGNVISDATTAVRLFRQYLNWFREKYPVEFEALIAPLRGKNLACFCKVGDPCHADVWIEFAKPFIES